MLTDEQIEFFLKHADLITAEQLRTFMTQYIFVAKKIREVTALLVKGEQELKERADMITKLSNANLALVAKLAQLIGNAAPHNTFAA